MTDNEKFDQACRDIAEIRTAIMGNEKMGVTGIVKRLEQFGKQVSDHETDDQKRFEIIDNKLIDVYNFQNKFTLFTGWTKWVLVIIWTLANTVITWALTYFSK